MKVIGAQAGTAGQLLQAGHRLGVLDEPADLRDLRRMLLGQRRLIGLAALARTKARSFGVRARGVELHVLGPGEASCAGGAAVHAGRVDRVEELAVRRRIAGDNGSPAGIVQRGGCKLLCVEPRFSCAFLHASSEGCNVAGGARLRTPSLAFEFQISRGCCSSRGCWFGARSRLDNGAGATVREMPRPAPVTERGRGSFLHP